MLRRRRREKDEEEEKEEERRGGGGGRRRGHGRRSLWRCRLVQDGLRSAQPGLSPPALPALFRLSPAGGPGEAVPQGVFKSTGIKSAGDPREMQLRVWGTVR